MTAATFPCLAGFIDRWKISGGSEQANSQLFLAELCDVLELPRPQPALPDNEQNTYSFERKVYVPRGDGTQDLRRLDLYRRGCFVLESKQARARAAAPSLSGMTSSSAVKRGTRPWDDAMLRAKRQAENYVRSLPAGEGRPPFVMVCDVGYCLDLYSEFSRTGGQYLPFPDIRHHRIMLEDLEHAEVRDLLRAIWLDPLSLDPSLRAAKVTEEVAGHLAQLAVRLESGINGEGTEPERVASFLMRCLFTMFAEDVGLLPIDSFKGMLEESLIDPEPFEATLTDLWNAMNEGRASVYLRKRLKRFNGNIFKDPEVLPLDIPAMGILLEAARADWKEVEPAIFGTLLERALNPRERHKLGAHYTPRAYVERLVVPTVITPLRAEWENVQTAASLLAGKGKMNAARDTVDAFHRKLCQTRVLDPACGSGNFLYVTFEHMKRLESEVMADFTSYGGSLKLEAERITVDPHQFLGLELNPRAAHIAEMVLWIGYLQWHFRTQGNVSPPEPIIKQFRNIRHQDAVLAWKRCHPAVDKDGTPVTRWDGVTFKVHPATGREVPDEAAQIQDQVYEGVTPAAWPEAEFVVGNPPFVGGGLKRGVLGHGYFDALTRTYANLPEACDFVMYWWHKAAELTRKGRVRQFGFITTSSITQVFNRRVTAAHLNAKPPLHLLLAIPDHPWVDAKDGAAVRIAMTAGAAGQGEGVLRMVTREEGTDNRERDVELVEQQGVLHPHLRIGVDVTKVAALRANSGLCSRGMALHGAGFIVTPEQARQLGLGRIDGLERHIRAYRNGRDLTDKPRNVMVIDLFGLSAEEVCTAYPEVYQWVLERVKPERDVNNRPAYRAAWWVFGEPRREFRPALAGLSRYIATVETAKHRVFAFLDETILPDNMLVTIASADAYLLGVLSSRIHVCWALAAGGRLGVGNDPRYNKSICFNPFPFPTATPEQKEHIRELGERLDAHRKQRQALHPELTLTGMYNVLEALREGRELNTRERTINEQGVVEVLRKIHDDLDAAVAAAYGWPVDMDEQEILSRLVALNVERVQEEREGRVRWLRPEYQCLEKQASTSLTLGALAPAAQNKSKKAVRTTVPWPTALPGQVQGVRQALASLGGAASLEGVAQCFARAPRALVGEILASLEGVGIVELRDGEIWRLI